MRVILILIVIIAIFAVVQSKRHDCEFGGDGWLDCVIGKTTDEFSFMGPEASRAEASTETSTPDTPHKVV